MKAADLGLHCQQIAQGPFSCVVHHLLSYYHIYPKYRALINSADPDQMLQNMATDQSLHCLPIIQQFIHISTSSKICMLIL